MYEVKAMWAGYVLRHHTRSSIEKVKDILQAIEEEFNEGMIHFDHGSEMKIGVLCVDILKNGKIILQKDLKK